MLCYRKQGNKLRRLMTFAWPCLLSKNCVDPATKYHGHLLLAHIIAKFAIHKRIVLQVRHRMSAYTEIIFPYKPHPAQHMKSSPDAVMPPSGSYSTLL
jgi:hypothetical protein